MSRRMQIFHHLDEKIAETFLADFHQDRLYVIIVSTKLNGKAISKHIECQYMRMLNINVIYVTTKLQ